MVFFNKSKDILEFLTKKGTQKDRYAVKANRKTQLQEEDRKSSKEGDEMFRLSHDLI